MKMSRARFKHCLRFCKSIESKARADALAKKFLLKDNISFWKDIRKINRDGSGVHATTVDGINGEKNITEL